MSPYCFVTYLPGRSVCAKELHCVPLPYTRQVPPEAQSDVYRRSQHERTHLCPVSRDLCLIRHGLIAANCSWDRESGGSRGYCLRSLHSRGPARAVVAHRSSGDCRSGTGRSEYHSDTGLAEIAELAIRENDVGQWTGGDALSGNTKRYVGRVSPYAVFQGLNRY